MSWKEQYRQQLDDRDDSPFYKLVAGTNVFRSLPNFHWEMSDDPGEWPTVVEYLKHKNVGPKERLVACGKKIEADGTLSGDCWLCDTVIPKYSASANEKERGRADAMHPVPFSVMQVSPVKNGKFMPPKTLELQVGGDRSWGGKVMNYLLRPDRFYEHPLKGKNFVVVKKVDATKKGPSGTSYPIVEVEEEVTKVPKAIFDMRKPFEDLLPVYDEAEQRAALKGEDYQRNRTNDGWDAPEAGAAAGGYDETGGGNAETDSWGAEAAPGGEGDWENEGGHPAYGEPSEEYPGWFHDGQGGYVETLGDGEGDGTEAVANDGAGWGDDGAEGGEVANEEWGADDATGTPGTEGADSWDDTPAPAPPPPPARAPVKKGPPPAPAPVKKGPPPAPPAPPVKKGPPVKKAAPPPPPPPPVKKGPPPPPAPVKKGPPPPPAPVKKGPPPPVKKGPARR